jgi:hypothetical protein
VAWTPIAGWLYEADEAREMAERGPLMIAVSDDGRVHVDQGAAVLSAVLRIDADVTELVLRLQDIADQAHEAFAALRTGGGL